MDRSCYVLEWQFVGGGFELHHVLVYNALSYIRMCLVDLFSYIRTTEPDVLMVLVDATVDLLEVRSGIVVDSYD